MRRFAHAAIAAICALIVSASAAHAANTSCTGTLSGSITGNILVPSGASCTVSDATVTGDVQVFAKCQSHGGRYAAADDNRRQYSGQSVRVRASQRRGDGDR
jgi:hypothetical protein